MTYQIYTGSGNTVLAAVKRWEPNYIAGMLLSPFGTVPHRNTVAPDAVEQAISLVAKVIRAQLEFIVSSEKREDIRFAATMILDAMRQCNDRLREINKTMGMGIYIGGNVFYAIGSAYLILPFGGGCFLMGPDARCVPEEAPNHPLIRDALGCMPIWSAEFRKGDLEENGKIILLTAAPGKYESFRQELNEDRENALVMYAHRTFSTDGIPVAAIEMAL